MCVCWTLLRNLLKSTFNLEVLTVWAILSCDYEAEQQLNERCFKTGVELEAWPGPADWKVPPRNRGKDPRLTTHQRLLPTCSCAHSFDSLRGRPGSTFSHGLFNLHFYFLCQKFQVAQKWLHGTQTCLRQCDCKWGDSNKLKSNSLVKWHQFSSTEGNQMSHYLLKSHHGNFAALMTESILECSSGLVVKCGSDWHYCLHLSCSLPRTFVSPCRLWVSCGCSTSSHNWNALQANLIGKWTLCTGGINLKLVIEATKQCRVIKPHTVKLKRNA